MDVLGKQPDWRKGPRRLFELSEGEREDFRHRLEVANRNLLEPERFWSDLLSITLSEAFRFFVFFAIALLGLLAYRRFVPNPQEFGRFFRIVTVFLLIGFLCRLASFYIRRFEDIRFYRKLVQSKRYYFPDGF